MAVTLIYRPQATPQGDVNAAAVYETLEEALMQAGWDLHIGGNRDPDRIIDGAHHGSPDWPAHEREQTQACDADAKVLATRAQIRKAATIVRSHFVVHDADVADPTTVGFGRPRQPADEFTPSPSVQACFDDLAELTR